LNRSCRCCRVQRTPAATTIRYLLLVISFSKTLPFLNFCFPAAFLHILDSAGELTENQRLSCIWSKMFLVLLAFLSHRSYAIEFDRETTSSTLTPTCSPTCSVTFAAPTAQTFKLPAECETVNFITACGGTGGHFGPNPWGDKSGGRGACLNVTGPFLRAIVERANYIVVGQGGSNVNCGGGSPGSGGGGLTGLFRGNGTSLLLVAAGGGGASRRPSSCDAVGVGPGSGNITGASVLDANCAATNDPGSYFGLGGRESDDSVARGVNGTGFPSWLGGNLSEPMSCGTVGGFGGGGSGGDTHNGFGCGGGGAGYPGGGMCAEIGYGGPAGRSFVDASSLGLMQSVLLTLNLPSNASSVTGRGPDGTLTIRCSGPNMTTTANTAAATTTTTTTTTMPMTTTPSSPPTTTVAAESDGMVNDDDSVLTDNSLFVPLIVVSVLLCIAAAIAVAACVYAIRARSQTTHEHVALNNNSESNARDSSFEFNGSFSGGAPQSVAPSSEYAALQVTPPGGGLAHTQYSEIDFNT
jgi:hypothetical protein